ncbi:MAG: hypothetical protein MHPSP_002193, partial [Paramarteilia canceri]
IDNTSCHSNLLEDLKELKSIEKAILRLFPYSTMFNLMENARSSAKAKIKRELAGKLKEILRSTSQG